MQRFRVFFKRADHGADRCRSVTIFTASQQVIQVMVRLYGTHFHQVLMQSPIVGAAAGYARESSGFIARVTPALPVPAYELSVSSGM